MTARTDYLPPDVGWHNWGTLFTDVELWRPVVQRICQEHDLAEARRVEGGYPGSCAVFIVDGQIVVKLFPPWWHRDWRRESEVYRLLAGRVPYLPRLLAEGVYQDQLDWPYLAFSFCEGVAIRDLNGVLTAEERRRLGQRLGRMLRIVHATSLEGDQTFDPRPSAWRNFLNERRASCLGELRAQTALPESLLDEVEPFLDSVPLPIGEPLSLLHADLTEDHLLLSTGDTQYGLRNTDVGTRISAVIDWSDAEAGTPEYEWVALWFGLCNRHGVMFREVLHAYDPGLRLDENFRRRMMAYTFLHRFGAGIIADSLGRDGNPSIRTLMELQVRLWSL